MKTLEASYLAGFFDGEGSVFATQNGQGLRYVTVALANNYKPILDQAKAQFGGCISKANKDCWNWHTTNADAVFTFLTYIQPHLILKGREVAVALAIVSTVNARGKRYTDRELLVRERLFDMLTEAGDQRRRPFTGKGDPSESVNVTRS